MNKSSFENKNRSLMVVLKRRICLRVREELLEQYMAENRKQTTQRTDTPRKYTLKA